jgi:hypothetical protein
MRRFFTGLLLGVALTYGWYERGYYLDAAKQWFAEASSDPDAEDKLDDLFSRRR